MGEIVKHGSRNVVLMYFGALIGFINTILLYPKILPKAEFGLISLIVGIATLISAISNFGTSIALIRYFPRFRNESKASGQALIRYLALLSGGISLLAAFIMIVCQQFIFNTYADNAPLLITYFYYIFPLFFAQVFINLLSSHLNAIKKSSVQVFQKEVFVRMGQTVLIGFYYLGYIDISLFIPLYVALFVISLFFLIGYLIKVDEFSLSRKRLDQKIRREVFQFSMFTFLSGIARQIAFRIDTIMLGAMIVSAVMTGVLVSQGFTSNVGLEAVGVYMVAFNMASMLEMPFRALNQSLAPSIAVAWTEKNMDKILELYKKSTETMMAIGVFIAVGIWACVDEILEILPDSYSEVKYVLGWLLLGKLLNVVAGPNGLVLINSPKYKILTYFTFFGLALTIIFNYFFINWFQIEGAAMATFVTYAILNFSVWAVIARFYELQPFTFSNLVTIILGIGILFLTSFVNFYDVWGTIFAKAILITVLYWVAVYVLKLSPEINNLIESKLLNRFRRSSKD